MLIFTDTMVGIQINNNIVEKGRGDIFLINMKFPQHISDKIIEIHRNTVKFEDFCGNFHRYNDKLTNTIRM